MTGRNRRIALLATGILFACSLAVFFLLLKFSGDLRSLMLWQRLRSANLVRGEKVLGPAQDNRFEVVKGEKHGYINQEGTLVIPITLEGSYLIDFSEGYASFVERVKPEVGRARWGFIDTSGAVVISPQFDFVREFSEGLAAVAFPNQQVCSDCDTDLDWGFINKSGKLVIQPQYHSVSSFSEELAAVRNDNRKWGYIDTKGELVIPFLFESAGEFSEGLAPVAVNQQFGYIDKLRSFVIKPQYAEAGRFSEGLAAVRTRRETDDTTFGPAGGTWTFIGKDGKKRIDLPKNARHASDFAEGLAVIRVDGAQCGYVHTSGEIAIMPRFIECGNFSENLANVLNNSANWQYIDKQGRVVLDVLDVPYHRVGSFKNGLAKVYEGRYGSEQSFGYIDKHGKQVWKP